MADDVEIAYMVWHLVNNYRRRGAYPIASMNLSG